LSLSTAELRVGAALAAPLQSGENVNSAQSTVRRMLQLPLFVKLLYALILRFCSRPAGRNDAWASLIEVFHEKSTVEEHKLIIAKEAYKAEWHRARQEQGLDFVLTVPHALPPVPLGGSGTATLVSAGYTFLYNILDYCAGVIPVTYVDERLDRLPSDFRTSEAYRNMNDVAQGAYTLYDASAMHGLPLAVQVVGGRLEEEKVLAGMREAERALWEAGKGFVQKKF